MTVLILWLLGILAAGAALISCLTYLFFIYELGNEAQKTDMAGGERVSLAVIALCTARSFRSQFLVSLLYPLGLLDRWLYPIKRLGPGTGPPFLLVHGLYHNSSAWLSFSRRLKKRGIPRVHAYSYFSLGTDFSALLERLNAEVDKSLEATQGEPLVLVGHSLGGLLIRAYVSSEESRGKVRLAVTLGAPHQGSRLAALGIGRLARSLIHRGPLIKDIESRDRKPEIPCLSLSTDTDNFVLPPSALGIDLPGWDQDKLPAQSHVCHLFHKSAFDKTLDFILQKVS